MILNIFVLHLVGLLSPGPDFFFVSRTAAASTRRETTLGILGITIGIVFWLFCSIFGLSALLYAYPSLQGVIMLCGGSYLCYMALQLLKVRHNLSLNDIRESSTIIVLNNWQAFRRGLFVNLSNPKVVVYFGSILSLVLGGIDNISDMLVIVVLILAESFAYFYGVSLIFSHPKIKGFYMNNSRYFDNFAGVIFGCFGLFLIYSSMQHF